MWRRLEAAGSNVSWQWVMINHIPPITGKVQLYCWSGSSSFHYLSGVKVFMFGLTLLLKLRGLGSAHRTSLADSIPWSSHSYTEPDHGLIHTSLPPPQRKMLVCLSIRISKVMDLNCRFCSILGNVFTSVRNSRPPVTSKFRGFLSKS